MPERIDRRGEHKTALRKNKKIILATQEVCGLCGAPVDKTLKAPDPLSPTVDHIIPIAKGGHPSSLDNLQLAHRWCNLHKGDRLYMPGMKTTPGSEERSGMKKAPGIKKDRGTLKDPPPAEPPGVKQPTPHKGGLNLDAIDNDDLPLHADWATLTW